MAKIKVSKLGERFGDNCEKCETEVKPIYRLKQSDFGIDIILCPKCVKKFKKIVKKIEL